MVVESVAFTGIRELDLAFSPVNDSIHTQVYMCRVTRDGGDGMTVTAVQNFTVNVVGNYKIMMVSILIIMLLCTSQFSLLLNVITSYICSSQFQLIRSLPVYLVQALP